MQLRYPALATQQSKHIRSPYYWSAEYTLTDLMELISALHASGAIRKADGTPAELNKLVRTFELLLNVSFKNPDRCRNATLNRKVNVTKFLDALKQALVERSQR